MFIPNARVEILRGTYVDEFDDTHDSAQVVAKNVPASLVMRTFTAVTPETGRSFDVQVVEGIVRPTVDVLQGDRIRNQANGLIYTVDAVNQGGLFVEADKTMKLRLLSA